MAFRGWFALNGQELANSSRVVAHLTPSTPTLDTVFTDPHAGTFCGSCKYDIIYDDSWPGLRAALGDSTYVLANAPWYNASIPESAEFGGVWVMKVDGLDSAPVVRTIQELISSGGAPGPVRLQSRKVTFNALLLACSNAGAEYGKRWLNCLLRSTDAVTGTELDFYAAHPGGTAATPASLRRSLQSLVLTNPVSIQSYAGLGADQNRQSSLYNVSWEMTALNPYVYGPPTVLGPVSWTTTTTDAIVWVHAPGCTDLSSCDDPVVYNAACVPADVSIASMPIPSCGGCIPVCSLTQKTYTLAAGLPLCDETAVTLEVANTGAGPLTANFWWQPHGSSDPCAQFGQLQVAGLPAGDTAVADSVSGRPYVIDGGVPKRQVGIISTPSGAPWAPTIIDRTMSWDLVMETAPGTSVNVSLVFQDREP